MSPLTCFGSTRPTRENKNIYISKTIHLSPFSNLHGQLSVNLHNS